MTLLQFFSSVYFYFYRTTVLSRMIFPQTSPQGIILNSLELWHLLIISLHLYILISCKVFCYFWISYSLKENEFPLLSVFGIKCRRGFDHMHVTYIYISTIHVTDACNQMKWPIKQYHQGIGVPLFLERY